MPVTCAWPQCHRVSCGPPLCFGHRDGSCQGMFRRLAEKVGVVPPSSLLSPLGSACPGGVPETVPVYSRPWRNRATPTLFWINYMVAPAGRPSQASLILTSPTPASSLMEIFQHSGMYAVYYSPVVSVAAAETGPTSEPR